MAYDSTDFVVVKEHDDVTVLLQKAKDLIERGWCQGSSARDEYGYKCQIADGVSFCSLGAINKASRDDPDKRFKAVVRLANAIRPSSSSTFVQIANFNDNHTKDQVLAIFDKAINSN